MPDPWSMLDASAQAHLVRRREVTPDELLRAAIARIERLNPRLNAVIRPVTIIGTKNRNKPHYRGLAEPGRITFQRHGYPGRS